MDHVAIMKRSWEFTKKILNGEKTIESRWYSTKRVPWGLVKPGETVYFKDSGMPVTVKASVSKVMEFSGLDKDRVEGLLHKYRRELGIRADMFTLFLDMHKDKRYCILVFLKRPESVKPFDIDKGGFGMLSAWIAVKSIDGIRLDGNRY